VIALSAGVDLAALVLCVLFLAYVALILVPFLQRTPDRPGDAADFRWHLILPCLDEEVVIARTVTRLRMDHPSAHLWCVDDDSSDATGVILGKLQRRDPYVHRISRRAPDARQGKGAALNAAWVELTAWLAEHDPEADPARVIVGVVDADGRLDPAASEAIGPAPVDELMQQGIMRVMQLQEPGQRVVVPHGEGFALVELIERLPPAPLPFEKVRPQLEAQLRAQRAGEAFQQLVEELRAKAKLEVDEAALAEEAAREPGPGELARPRPLLR
jgi:hypothetical protein